VTRWVVCSGTRSPSRNICRTVVANFRRECFQHHEATMPLRLRGRCLRSVRSLRTNRWTLQLSQAPRPRLWLAFRIPRKPWTPAVRSVADPTTCCAKPEPRTQGAALGADSTLRHRCVSDDSLTGPTGRLRVLASVRPLCLLRTVPRDKRPRRPIQGGERAVHGQHVQALREVRQEDEVR
jgi:hypothetical protein